LRKGRSTAATLRACALRAEAAGLDDLWTVDHIAIPPAESEGSGGRYLDPLATLSFLAGIKLDAVTMLWNSGNLVAVSNVDRITLQ
jgi:hypothetical protein